MGRGGNGNITYSYTTPHIPGGRVLNRSAVLQLKPKVEAIAAKLLTAYVAGTAQHRHVAQNVPARRKELPA